MNQMLTYDLTKTDGPLYKCLYECIKNDISQGKLSSGEKMPSKRTLAKNLGVSTITVENAYDQLIGEGYMFARPKKGYFIADVSDIRVIKAPVQKELSIKLPPEQDESIFDFSSNRTDSGNFPFPYGQSSCERRFPLGSRSFVGVAVWRSERASGSDSKPSVIVSRYECGPGPDNSRSGNRVSVRTAREAFGYGQGILRGGSGL